MYYNNESTSQAFALSSPLRLALVRDGTKIKIEFRTKGLDPISGDLVNGHIALLSIEK